MDTSKAIGTLNDLIETCLDSEQGFRQAAQAVKDAHLRAMFERFSRQRSEMARELEEQVRRLGGNPEDSGSTAGSLRRGWTNVKSLVGAGNDGAITAEAEQSEDTVKAAFEKALAGGLPAGAHELVEQQCAIVRTAHDEVRALEKTHAR